MSGYPKSSNNGYVLRIKKTEVRRRILAKALKNITREKKVKKLVEKIEKKKEKLKN
jgi:hypothetical protein